MQYSVYKIDVLQELSYFESNFLKSSLDILAIVASPLPVPDAC